MAWRLAINLGFVTNSSTAIYYIPRIVLEDPEVINFMSVYEISDGYVGKDLFNRSSAESVLITEAQKKEVKAAFDAASEENTKQGWGAGYPYIDANSSADIVTIFGDEYSSLTNELSRIMCAAVDRINKLKGLDLKVIKDEYH